jgi:hypothetical protein
MLKEVVIQDLTEPMGMLKKCSTFRETFKYQSYGSALNFKQRNLELRPNDQILHPDNAPAHKAFSVKQFLAQKSITEMEHPPCSSDLVPNDFWLFPK